MSAFAGGLVQYIAARPSQPGTDRTGPSDRLERASGGPCLSDHRSNPARRALLDQPCSTEAMEAGRGWGQGALIRGQTSSSAGVGEHNWSAEDLNVYDWGFLRENLKNKKEAEEAAELQNGFFDFLKECKMKQDRKPYFYIEKDEAAYFMRKFTEKRLMDTTFAIKSDRAHQYRNARYNEILVRISDSRIGLGTRSLFFVDEIMGPMKQHVGDNYRLVYGKLPSKTPAKVTSAEKYVEEITKVTHLMMVIKMLFGNAKPTSF
ncbi:hypothetical protein PCANC_15916 [Puccinia coronata f. sp. avenae]|uniref:Uncharacterized protein n=1 Tax=Puccinia coronata f. sp. avenae TaxID=200324 RepID=A0A2N5UMN7_9BASI|nr:hypothetical protein PCASD_15163 [Puccinia coronata f. sp. avenae]PLW38906.1 hypothetical protein PCANC_15916 [Puccinia coronata f. sp. avenae]